MSDGEKLILTLLLLIIVICAVIMHSTGSILNIIDRNSQILTAIMDKK
jgi:uncharacterized protein YybS (DUF2232 family)